MPAIHFSRMFFFFSRQTIPVSFSRSMKDFLCPKGDKVRLEWHCSCLPCLKNTKGKVQDQTKHRWDPKRGKKI